VRVRRYDAEFANGAATVKATDGTRNEVNIGGTDSYLRTGPLMTMKDSVLTIVVPPGDGRSGFGGSSCDIDGFAWHEISTAGEVFALCGTWRGSSADLSRIEGTITGTFEFYVNSESRTPLSCYATDHYFALNRTGGSSTR
jgi:hypothetical protein